MTGALAPPAGSGQGGSGQAAATDPAEYARLAELRQRLRLTDEALAGIGCDGPGAEAVLMRLRGWYEMNAAAWGARLRATAAARRELQAALRRVNVGPPGEAARLRAAQAKPGAQPAPAASRASIRCLTSTPPGAEKPPRRPSE